MRQSKPPVQLLLSKPLQHGGRQRGDESAPRSSIVPHLPIVPFSRSFIFLSRSCAPFVIWILANYARYLGLPLVCIPRTWATWCLKLRGLLAYGVSRPDLGRRLVGFGAFPQSCGAWHSRVVLFDLACRRRRLPLQYHCTTLHTTSLQTIEYQTLYPCTPLAAAVSYFPNPPLLTYHSNNTYHASQNSPRS